MHTVLSLNIWLRNLILDESYTLSIGCDKNVKDQLVRF